MTSSRFRLLLRDLAAGAAFGSVAISGEIPILASAIFLSGLLIALLGYRIFSKAGLVTGVVLGVTAVFLLLLVLTGKIDLVIAACTFAALLTLQRLLVTPNPGTDGQVYFTSLLMLSGGAALSGELLFGLSLFLFAFLAVVSMGLGVVQEAAGNERIPTRAVTRQLALGAVAAMLGSMVFFAAFPRLSWNVAPPRMARGLGGATTGLSERITFLGAAGQLKRNPRVVLHVKLKPDPKVPRLKEHWFANSLEEFDGLEWRPRGHTEVIGQRVQLESALPRSVRQEFEILPAFGSTTLIALEHPIQFENAILLNNYSKRPIALVINRTQNEVRLSAGAQTFTYEAVSTPSRLQPKKDPSEEEQERLLQLPRRLDPRVLSLSAQIAGSEANPERKALRLEAFLRSNYKYSLELPAKVDDPLSHFLFETKSGHCEYFATALAILLRARGIPSRVATGFYGGERQGDRYILRAGDAHAWTQAWIDGEWFSFDATPEADRGGQASPLVSWFARQYDGLENFWRSAVVDYSGKDQMQWVDGLGDRKIAGYLAFWKGVRLSPHQYLFASLLLLLFLWGGLRWRTRLLLQTSEAGRLRRSIERAAIRSLNYRPADERLEEFARRANPRRTSSLRCLDPRARPLSGRPIWFRAACPSGARSHGTDAGRSLPVSSKLLPLTTVPIFAHWRE